MIFITKLRKIKSVDKTSKTMPEPKNTIEKLSNQETKNILKFLLDNFDLDLSAYFSINITEKFIFQIITSENILINFSFLKYE